MQRANWAGNYVYRARAVHVPHTVEALQELVAGRPRLRVLGSRHAFTGIADSDELVCLDGLPRHVAVDAHASVVRCNAALRYGELALELARQGWALANLASLPHISIAGAVMTATHGSGTGNGNLATAVTQLEMVTSDGNLLTAARGDPDFEGMVVGLGALGAVTHLTLRVEPAFQVTQHVFNGLRWEALRAHFDDIMASGYSVSVFSRWAQTTDQVWVKRRVGDGAPPLGDEFFGAPRAPAHQHPIPGLDPVNCTPQLGLAGAWYERLPHFRMDFTPSSGAEIQSEYVVPRRHAVAAVEAVRGLSALVGPLTQVSEIRAVAGDGLWMSPQYGQDTIAIHFTWKPDRRAVEHAVAQVERALAPFEARPHWGKLFLARAPAIAPLYDRWPDFAALVARLDPRGAFRNRWLEQHVLGPTPG